MSTINRRHFLMSSAAGAAAAAARKARAGVSPTERVIVGIMGIRGRGSHLARAFAQRPDVEVAWLCDVDSSLYPSRVKSVVQAQGLEPKTTNDVRRILDDKNVDVLVSATPDHWHALSTVWGCQAGKDVYVEKPCSHSLWEGRKMIEAARKYKRVVQLGTQSRSAPYMMKAADYIRSGKLGDVHYCKVVNIKDTRGPIPKQPDGPVPENLDYDKWLGPVSMRPYNPTYVRRWNWIWDFSGGDIINDAIHQIDLARWMIDKPYPKSAVAFGGSFHWDDAGEAPDTQICTYEYDDMTLSIEVGLWNPYMKKIPMDIRNADRFPNWPQCATRVEIYGTKAMMVIGRHGGGWQVFGDDWSGEPKEYGREPTEVHIENFIDCVRSRDLPNADIEKGHRSTILSHLGNISYRVGGRKLIFDGRTESFANDDEANRLLKRNYRKPYVIPETV